MNLVLGVSGSVAAYRAADLARELMRSGFTVRVCLTDAAQKFVSPVLFEALTGQPCLIDAFEEPERGRMAHIDWARQADAIVVAPATANTIARIAHGIGDDMLTTLCLASTAPLVVAPAMNPQMYAGEAHQEALEKLRARAAVIVEPVEGDVACGEHGQGKLASIPEIVEAVKTVAGRSQKLAGQSVLITSGPTQEAIDGVRYLSNRSSGKMGAALARAALLMGAQRVVIVSGPVAVPYPLQAEVVRVVTACDMLEAAQNHAGEADWIIGAAAVADYRPAHPQPGKIRRSAEPLAVELTPNPDVIAELAKLCRGKVVGFAAEPSGDLAEARAKIERKGLAAIAVNDVSRPGIGFESDRNALTLIMRDGTIASSGVMSKLACALWLIEAIASRAG
ncbi:MAG TPA: bifunctional phosphopantothenoylcysteine decarboxylase/phosphopantothenate--cysteine ligase CoaBC [Fimbriimonadaceae bacterium]|nr:bifunctional phosphopantothenoylcysteine decarboxylase/phosphopantothenate--cysteine ligase CoaBC [Fimbriimonadaceae bacterium]